MQWKRVRLAGSTRRQPCWRDLPKLTTDRKDGQLLTSCLIAAHVHHLQPGAADRKDGSAFMVHTRSTTQSLLQRQTGKCGTIRLMSSIYKSLKTDSVSSYLHLARLLGFVLEMLCSKNLSNTGIWEIVQVLSAPVPQLASLTALLDSSDLFVNPVKRASACAETDKMPYTDLISLA